MTKIFSCSSSRGCLTVNQKIGITFHSFLQLLHGKVFREGEGKSLEDSIILKKKPVDFR